MPEFSRPWFAAQQRHSYSMDDIIAIAHGQLALEEQLAQGAQWLVCDTTVLVCIIWAQVRFGECPAALAKLWQPADYAIHLLTVPDLPWQDDPLRENPHDRAMLFELYRQALLEREIAPVLVQGHGRARSKSALNAIHLI